MRNEAVWCCVGEAHLLEYLPNCSQLSLFFISLQVTGYNQPATSLGSVQLTLRAVCTRVYHATCLLFQHPTHALTYRKVGPVCLVNIRLYRKGLAVLVLMHKHCFLCDLTSGCHVLLQHRWLVRPEHSRPCFQRSTAACCSCARAYTT